MLFLLYFFLFCYCVNSIFTKICNLAFCLMVINRCFLFSIKFGLMVLSESYGKNLWRADCLELYLQKFFFTRTELCCWLFNIFLMSLKLSIEFPKFRVEIDSYTIAMQKELNQEVYGTGYTYSHTLILLINDMLAIYSFNACESEKWNSVKMTMLILVLILVASAPVGYSFFI